MRRAARAEGMQRRVIALMTPKLCIANAGFFSQRLKLKKYDIRPLS
jgi:hypothetical protein